MFPLLTVLILIAAILLILVVVIQNSKGGGLAAGFASSNQIMGVRKTTDFLEKATWYLAGAIVILSIISGHYLRSGQETDVQKTNQQIEKAAKKESQTPVAAPIELPTRGSTPAPAGTEPK